MERLRAAPLQSCPCVRVRVRGPETSLRTGKGRTRTQRGRWSLGSTWHVQRPGRRDGEGRCLTASLPLGAVLQNVLILRKYWQGRGAGGSACRLSVGIGNVQQRGFRGERRCFPRTSFRLCREKTLSTREGKSL